MAGALPIVQLLLTKLLPTLYDNWPIKTIKLSIKLIINRYKGNKEKAIRAI